MFAPFAQIEAGDLTNKEANQPSSLDERLLDHEVSGLTVIALDKAART